jgi:malate dehydrogenase (oxaloacetate-decarboxylating)(NADP+)
VCLHDIGHAIDTKAGTVSFGLSLMLGEQGHTIFIADTLVHERPNPRQLAEIVIGAAAAARLLGHEPRVALLSHSTFGSPMHATGDSMREAVALLDARGVGFEYDGEMSPDVALDPSYRALYPFCRLTGPANVLVMPGLHSAHITSRLAPRLGGGGTIGPLIIGLDLAAQLVPMDSSVSQIVDIATIAAYQAIAK